MKGEGGASVGKKEDEVSAEKGREAAAAIESERGKDCVNYPFRSLKLLFVPNLA